MISVYGQRLERDMKNKMAYCLGYWNLDFYKRPTKGRVLLFLCVHVCVHRGQQYMKANIGPPSNGILHCAIKQSYPVLPRQVDL